MELETAANCFYVYALLDPRKPGPFLYGKVKFTYEPFYLGKGSSRRISKTLSKISLKHNPLKRRIVHKIKEAGLKVITVKLREGLSEQKAFEIEVKGIKKIGLRCEKTGPLTNLTKGGEGFKPVKRAEAKRKRNWRKAINNRTNKREKEIRAQQLKAWTPELRKRQSETISRIKKGKPLSAKNKRNLLKTMKTTEYKEKLSKAMKAVVARKKKEGTYIPPCLYKYRYV